MAIRTRLIHDIEDLRQPVNGADVAVSQIEAGSLSGRITYGTLGDFSLSLGHFSKAVRSHGIMSRDRQVIGMLLGRDDAVTHWSFDVRPGDVIFDHLGGSHDGLYKGGAAFATIAMSPDALTGLMAGETALADFDFWQHRTRIRPPAALGAAISSRFAAIVENLDQHAGELTAEGSDFWMRSVVEAFIGTVTSGAPLDGDKGPVKSAAIVAKVDDFLREHGAAPVHVSQLCQSLNLSRRTLHRAFQETLGVGPVTYLRRQRLNGVRRALTAEGAPSRPIAEIALNFGFDEMGRFAGYYRRLFGELPSETVRKVAANSH